MKILKKIAFLFLATMILACNSDDDNPEKTQNSSLVGKWELIEVYLDPGDGSGDWMIAEDSYEYNFTVNGNFTSTKYTECGTGDYSINSNLLTLDYDCEGFTTNVEDPEGTFVENFSFENDYLILVPTYMSCDEGCAWKFEKIVD